MKKIKYIAPELETISFESEDMLLASVELSASAYDDTKVEDGAGMRWGTPEV